MCAHIDEPSVQSYEVAAFVAAICFVTAPPQWLLLVSRW